MDSRIGLDYIVENSDYVSKLAAALDTNNEIVKKQVFELLSALCAYSRSGYCRAIETLENYKNLKNERYRFKVVVTELDKTAAIEFKVALLAFINCVIISAKSLQDRLRVRNEFIGLNLLPVLNNLRRIANSVPDLSVQLDVFDEQRECDESQSLQGPDGINLNSHLDVFYAILRQVADTPQEIPFLNILQHLLSIEPKDAISDIVWDTAETLVHRATLLENREDSTRLLRSPSIQKFSCPHCRSDITSPNRKLSLPHNLTSSTTLSTLQSHSGAIPVAPPLPTANVVPKAPPLPPAAPIPPPPPMIPNNNNSKVPPACPPAPNHLLNATNEVTRPKTPHETTSDSLKPLPQQETPTPRSKMKTINWNKIPPNKVVGKNNIWSIVADNHQNSPMAEMNWDEMEGLFCQQVTQGSPKLGRDTGIDTVDRRTRKDNEITLLDGKRSLNVNIFLKQFRSTNEEITQMIRDGEHDEIGAEKLRGLLKILPEFDELEMLKNFDGDKSRLGNAEKFLMQLLKVPNYKLRIECMLLKEEFTANLSYLDPSINAMLYAGEDLMMNKALQEVLYMVVVVGNFLNAGGYAGNAAGVKLSSLQKLTDIRANKPGMNLIHFVALQAEKKNRELLLFPEQFASLENASKTTIEQLNNEINALDKRIITIKKQIDLPSTEEDIKLQMAEFLKAAESEVSMLQRGMKELETTRVQLADFFCEDPAQFKIEECYKTFYQFCEKFKLAVKENEKRRVLEEQANIRRKQREEQLAKKRQFSQAGTPVSDSENSFLMDPPTYDIRFSPAMSRRRMGSFNSNGDVIMRDEGASPDITPNGSLRRRRSRVLSEEDEGNLMDFLRSSGHDGATRERKSAAGYGSLDRSWARRARSGSANKKRPDLLNVDFGADRERPASPSPVIESKPLPEQEDPKPRISREWRQKIENWLQANEQDEKQNEEYRRKMRRVTSNRRSLETDTESEKGSKLDTLPEEKSHHSPSSQNQPTTTTTIPTIQTTSAEPYRRVYPEWKPSSTLDKTDVVGTIETLAGMTYVQTHARDKSAWRKSNLNVSNSSEEADNEARRYRRQRSREGSITSISGSPLHSILEEDKKKNPIEKQPTHSRNSSDSSSEVATPLVADSNLNKQSIYIRPPADESIQSPTKHNSSIYIRPFESDPLSSLEDQPNVPRRIRRSYLNETNNKIEIDSDNIETPPTVRKNFNHHPSSSSNSERTSSIASHKNVKVPRPLHKIEDAGVEKKEQTKQEQEILGDGQFDRFSSARRTRRFKRPIDLSSATEDNITNATTTSPDSISDASFPILAPEVSSENIVKAEKVPSPKTETKSSPETIQSKESKNKVNNDVVSRIGKIGKSISRISQEDVREAIRSLKSPTPEREWSAKDTFRPGPLSSKIISHELNDEGFEETQSLVSDTPSLTTSSCNEEAKTKPTRLPSNESSTAETPKRRPIRPSNQLQTLIARNQQSLERSRSLRIAAPISSGTRSASSTPRRTASLRRPDTAQSSLSLPKSTLPNRRLDVERSNSRTSLRSSRSSLNSAVSTNTVKKMPLKPTTTASTLPKKPLVLQNTSTTSSSTPIRAISRVPASRSSSSGSSIGPTVRKPPTPTNAATSRLSSTVSTSFKENQNRSKISPASSATSTKTNGSGNGLKSASPSGRSSSFMRPTTASATKVKSK